MVDLDKAACVIISVIKTNSKQLADPDPAVGTVGFFPEAIL